jgi:2-keto-4-pentenoate hydratase/2-oxohepta-3-ene-1,7-dioic acid hydratase in catechol pathway
MRFCRFVDKDGVHYGLVESANGRDLITARMAGPHLEIDPTGMPGGILLPDISQAQRLPSPIPLDAARLLIPLPLVTKVVAIGRNYIEHAKELQNPVPPEPLLFLKPPSSLLPSGGNIVKPKLTNRLDHEAELGVVIGRTCHKLRPDADIRDYILGYTCVNDVTARDIQRKDVQFTRGKGFDTFCPVGPAIATGLDTSELGVQGLVNGQLRQDGNTRDLIFNIDYLVRFIAEVMTLVPGDIIATGTPAGVGPMNVGDTVEVVVEGVGALRNPIVGE